MHKVYDPKLQWNPDVQYDIEEYCPECGNMIAVEIDRGDSRFCLRTKAATLLHVRRALRLE